MAARLATACLATCLAAALAACAPSDPALEAIAAAEAEIDAARSADAARLSPQLLARAQQMRARAAWHLEEARSAAAVGMAEGARSTAAAARAKSEAF